jgi:hypothetical protein
MVKVEFGVLYPAALIALVLSCASSEGRPQSHKHHTKMFQHHMDTVYAFGCSTPQRRLVQLKDLGIAVRPDVSYYPPATVLRRCDCATGFCSNPDHVCSANVTEEVELVFRITNQVEGSGQEYRTVNAVEHISCSCQPIINQIK